MTVDEIRGEFRKSITIDKLVNKEITSKISVTEGEIKDFYDKNKDSFNLPESYHVAHILVTPVADPAITMPRMTMPKMPTRPAKKLLSC